jgi:HAD superfamily hydrolase (TIGR01549 family)
VTPPRAVTFDFWQTLVAEPPGQLRAMQLERWSASLAEAGQHRSREEIEAAFAVNWERFEQRWHANTGQYTPADAVEFVSGHLGVTTAGGLDERLRDQYRIVGETAELTVAPGIEQCLRTLRDAGVKLAIVCDVGLTGSPILRARLESFGLLQWFDAWSFSDETGRFKPAPEAFMCALDALGVAPVDAAHVGDNARTDVAGAKALGMVAVQYVGLALDPPLYPSQRPSELADHVTDDLTSLPKILDVA